MSVDLDRLKNQLLTSGIQSKNAALYQVINHLIDSVKQLQATVNTAVATINQTINNVVNNIEGSGNTSNPIGLALESLGGSGDGGDGLIIPGSTGPPGPTGPTGPAGSSISGSSMIPDDSGGGDETIMIIQQTSGGSSEFVEWSVLTNGDPVSPELIFAGGDVIMTHTP